MKNSFTTVRHVYLPRWQRWQLSSQASKMLYKPPAAVYIASYKEPLDQSDCWKLFVQLRNYTKYVYLFVQNARKDVSSMTRTTVLRLTSNHPSLHDWIPPTLVYHGGPGVLTHELRAVIYRLT